MNVPSHVVWTVRVSPTISNRILYSSRSILNKFIPDIYINTHHTKGDKTRGFKVDVIREKEIQQGGDKLYYTCVGVGYRNASKEAI
ncbi:RNA 3'-terminal phosphate cyclase-like protein [Octopus sinensis]|uniref:RNA 3'-terminal phosphate cyclase-like protein n=1 Tax=Octopus sinensis TaxID=2607531 RepID=A0A6P7TQD4_9MOLL|nr:RNA 3'-terminal phosphate cyclase-like protein [Octopus sinensis]